jgi:hypothetical protein
MILSTAHLATDRSDRYIKQLVSHLGHKIEASVDGDGIGHVTMSTGASCTLRPDVSGIALHAQAETEEDLRRVEDVVGRHLLRFTKDEKLSREWAAA